MILFKCDIKYLKEYSKQDFIENFLDINGEKIKLYNNEIYKEKSKVPQETDFLIQVVDANEPPTIGYDISFVPAFLDNVRYVSESLSANSVFGNPLLSYDPDIDQTTIYSIIENFDASLFIGKCSGQLEIVKSVNFELYTNFTIVVQIKDDHAFSLKANEIFFIRVGGVSSNI